MRYTASLFLILGGIACSTNDSPGPADQTVATAGRSGGGAAAGAGAGSGGAQQAGGSAGATSPGGTGGLAGAGGAAAGAGSTGGQALGGAAGGGGLDGGAAGTSGLGGAAGAGGSGGGAAGVGGAGGASGQGGAGKAGSGGAAQCHIAGNACEPAGCCVLLGDHFVVDDAKMCVLSEGLLSAGMGLAGCYPGSCATATANHCYKRTVGGQTTWVWSTGTFMNPQQEAQSGWDKCGASILKDEYDAARAATPPCN